MIRISMMIVAAILVTSDGSAPLTAGDKKADTLKVAGILIDRDKRTLTVRADGDEKPTKYVLPETFDAKLAAGLKGLFTVQRVQITYQMVGDARQVTGIVRNPGKATGDIVGTVIAVHNDFWVEVKPTVGPPEGFASGAPDKSRAIVDVLKSLKPGDTVAIRYTSDFERHRIATIRKIEKKS